MLTTATIQYKAIPGLVETNRQNILRLCNEAIKNNANLIVLPEMCTTGYIWPDPDKIHSIAEESKGESFTVFSKFCLEKNCYMTYGFAEKNDNKFYNSQNLIGPNGALLETYRKAHLFEADLTWAYPGNKGFKFVNTPYGRMGMGICMDLNYDDFVNFLKNNNIDRLLFAANWLEEFIDVQSYWAMRLNGFNGTVFFANTYGFEYGIEFCGRSGIYERGKFIRSAQKEGDTVLITEHYKLNW